MENDRITRLIRRYSELSGIKQNFMSQWQEIVDYLMPYRQSITSEYSVGSKRMMKIFDSSPLYAQFLFTAELHSVMTNPSAQWFSLKMHDDRLNKLPEVQSWQYETTHTMLKTLNNSNFATQVNEGYLDYSGFGFFIMFIGEDPEDTVYFNTMDIGECVLGENNKGQVDTFMREFEWTARQCYQEFGNKCSSEVLTAAKERPERKFKIMHSISNRKDRDVQSDLPKNMKFESVYFERQTKQILRDSGFREFPIVAPRFSVTTGEVYGRGVGAIAIPDVKQLNQMNEDIMRAAQKKIDPPIIYLRDSFTGPIRYQPGGATAVRGTSAADKMVPFPAPNDLGFGDKLVEDKREQIGRSFFKDLIQVVRADRMTASEYMGRAEDKWRLMGPMLGRMHYEFLRPLVHRVFSIMYRRGELPPVPPVLQGQQYSAHFVSPLAQAQRLQEAQGIQRTMEMMVPVIQFKPEVADNWDWDAVIRILSEVNNVPPVINVPVEVVQQTREQRAQEMAQREATAQAQEAAKTVVPAVAKGGSPGSPLEAIMETLKGTAQAAQPELGVNPEME